MFLPYSLSSLTGYDNCCIIHSKIIFPIFLLFSSVSLFSQYQHVVINEISGDGGNIEARNDAIVELAGPPGTDIGCMVITNTEWAVVLPANTTIPADGVFLIGCEIGNNGGSGVYSGSQTGLSCSVCDFPGLVADFDVCNPANANYISTSLFTTYGFTLDNGYCGKNTDGDQVILFQPDGTPHDAIYWGGPDNTNANGGSTTIGGASGTCGSNTDHVAVQLGQAYLLGDNDDNGIVNDYTGTHIGFKADGNNATGVNKMPSGNDDLGNPFVLGQSVNSPPGDCSADAQKYWVPPLSDPIWVDAGLALVGCNSTHIRLNDSSPIGNSQQQIRPFTTSSHMDDPDLNPDWESYTATDLIPSSINPTLAAQQWQITNHPNPSLSNDVDTWDFFYDIGNGPVEITDADFLSLALCEEQPITFTLKVYNYQHVEPAVMTNNKAGSFVQDEAGSIQSWSIQSVGSNNTIGSAGSNQDGITTFQFTTNMLSAGTMNNFTLVWDDYTDCCGSGSIQTVLNQSNPSECYERIKIKTIVGESFQVSQTHIDCPSDFDIGVGTIDINDFVNSPNSNLQYTLKENTTIGQEVATGTTIGTSTTGLFYIPTSATHPIAVIVEDPLGCTSPRIITIGADCRDTPPCPMLGMAALSTSLSNTTVCQNENFTLSLDGTTSNNLPSGGQIDWHYGTDAIFDPFDPTSTGYGGILPNSSSITTAGPNCPSDGGSIFISELYDPPSGWECHRYIEIYNGGPCPQNLAGWTLYAIGNNNQVNTFPLSSTIAVGQALIASASCATDFTPDFVIPNGGDWNNGASSNFNGQSRDGAELYDNAGNLIDVAVLNTANTNNWFTNNVAIRRPSICSGFTQSSTLCGMAATCSYVEEHWMIMAGVSNANPHTHTVNIGVCPTSNRTTAITDATNSFDEKFCNQTLHIKGVVNPDHTQCMNADFITNTLSLTIACPEANLASKDINLCTPISENEILANINLANGSGSYDLTLEFIVNGNPITANYITVTSPLLLTYSEIRSLLGSPNFSEVEVRILSLLDAAGNSCEGRFTSDNIFLTVQNSPTVSVFKGNDIIDCTSESGAIIFDIQPSNNGPWYITYQLDNNEPLLVSTNESPLVVPVNQAGTYEVTNIVNEAGCQGIVTNPTIQIIELATELSINANDITLCNDGKEIHLDTTIIFNLNNNGILTEGNALSIGNISWYRNNPIGLPSLIQQSLLLKEDEKSIIPTTSATYYYIYQRTIDSCELSGEIQVMVGEEYCLASPESIASEETPIPHIPTMNTWGLWIFTLLILNLCLFFLRRLEQIKVL